MFDGLDVAAELGLSEQETALARRLADVVGGVSRLLTSGGDHASRRAVLAVADQAEDLSRRAQDLAEAWAGLLLADGAPAVRLGKVRQAASCWAQEWPAGRLLMNMTVVGVPEGLAQRVRDRYPAGRAARTA